MPVYEYKAILKTTGKSQKGVIDADSPAQARRKLRDQDLYPTNIEESTQGGAALAQGSGAKSGSGKSMGGRVSVRDLALMTRQLATLIKAGMPLVEALGALLEQTSRPRLQTAIYDVRDRVNGGSSLADALSEHPRIFSNLYVNMVRAGESSGTLEAILLRLADVLEHQAKLRGQILSSLAYPAFMAFFAVGVIVFLMLVIVPRITQIFQKQDAELPRLTEYMIKSSDFLGTWWWLILLIFFGIFSLWRAWISRPKGKQTWDRIKLRFPLYGTLHTKLLCARFARTLGTMLHSGLTMLPALDVVHSIINNAHIQAQMDDVKAGVRRGRDLATPLKDTGLFPPMMIHMIELGQRSGQIEEMLLNVSETYDEDVRLTIEAIVGLLEPVIIIIMGIFVGLLVLAILLPILNMSTNI